MTKDEAIKEVRIGALLKGGTWYLTKNKKEYLCVPFDCYLTKEHGRIEEIFNAAKVRRTIPPSNANA